jgi:DNA-binding transcriptional LysR family regulator
MFHITNGDIGGSMELGDIDLNQLVLFQQLMVERRVSRVADNLGITQPAVSNSLAKLRRLFGDELFVRTPGGMVPTPFAEQLAEPIGYALAMIHGGLNQQSRFDPATVKRSVTIGMTDIGEIVFLPTLVERLIREAPGVTVNTVRNSATNLRDDMESGKVDLAIGLLPQLKAGFFQRRLFRQRYVCLFRRGNPVDKNKMTLSAFRAAEHLLVVSAGTGHGKVDELLRRAGVDRVVRLTVPHFVCAGHILQGTNLVATVPERLAQCLAEPFSLNYLPHPVKLPEIAINVFWHAKAHRSPANQWLRGVVFDLFADDGHNRASSEAQP